MPTVFGEADEYFMPGREGLIFVPDGEVRELKVEIDGPDRKAIIGIIAVRSVSKEEGGELFVINNDSDIKTGFDELTSTDLESRVIPPRRTKIFTIGGAVIWARNGPADHLPISPED